MVDSSLAPSCLSVRPSVRPSVRLPVRLCSRLCARLSARPSARPSVYPSVCLCVRSSVCVSVRPSVLCPFVSRSDRPSLSVRVSVSVRPCVRLCPSVCPSLSVRLSARPSVCPSVCVCVRSSPFVRLCVRPSVGRSVGLSVRPSVLLCPFVLLCLFVSRSDRSSLSVSVRPPARLSPSVLSVCPSVRRVSHTSLCLQSGLKFSSIAALHSEFLLIERDSRKLYSWPCTEADSSLAVIHPLTGVMWTEDEEVSIFGACQVRATVVMKSGKITTFYDQILRG